MMTEEQAKKAVTVENLGNSQANTEVTNQEPQSQEPKSGSKEYNFRQMEQKNQDLEARLQQQEQLNKEIVVALNRGKPDSPQEEVLPELSPDDIPEWKHVKSYAEKIAEKKFRELTAQQERDKLPQLVKQRYTDFDEVVTKERIKKLEQEQPVLAKAFTLSEDPFTATYSYLKAIYTPQKHDPVALEEAEKILENANKPVSSNAIGAQGALKNATAFAKKSKDQLYKEMMAAAARAG